MWISFELNIFSFIPVLLNKTNINVTAASILYFIIRSIPKSQPNNMGQMSVRPSVRPQKVFPIPMKFGM